MINPSQLKGLFIFAVIIPLAIMIGYLFAQEGDPFSVLVLGLILLTCCLPFLLKSHQLILILSWNAAVEAFFLPGQPALWIVMAFVSFFFCVMQRTVNRETRLINVPFLTRPLIALGLIIIITALARGGIGLRSFGSSMIGARRYVAVIAAIVGYFALSCRTIPRNRAVLYASLFFLTGISAAMCDLIYAAGSSFYWLYYIFPPELARAQATSVNTDSEIYRIEGVAWASLAFFSFMLVRYGVRGILDIRRIWRLIALLLVVAVGLYGGFRSRFFWVVLLFTIQFCLEGLWRTRWLPILLGLCFLSMIIVLPNTDKLPPSIQRSLSFLPVKIDPVVVADAQESAQWRFDMWRQLRPSIPKYFWLGQGYTFSALEFEVMQEGYRRGTAKSYESFILTGEYHNGILSVIIPFGIFGLVSFLWFLVAGIRALTCNFRYGDPGLRIVNALLLASFLAKALFFTLSGALSLELAVFTGTLGLSVALNGGVKRKPLASQALPIPILASTLA